ncbi:MAG: rhombosortase, partial [Planctomycetota bacterium JB042]
MIVTSIVAAATLLLLAAPGAVALLELDRTAVAAGEAWRLLTGHLVHTSAGHAGWDLAALLLLGPALERRGRARFAGLLLAAPLAVSGAVLLGRPDLGVYRGLSGVATALFGALAVDLLRTPSRRTLGGLALVLAVLKVVSETVRGEPLFAENGVGFAPVPIAHAAGLVTGVSFQLLASILRWETMMNLSKRSLTTAALALVLLSPASLGADRFVAAPLESLDLDGRLPPNLHRAWWRGFRSGGGLMIPRVVLDGPGEAYVDRRTGAGGRNERELILVARIPDGGATGGRLLVARDDDSGMDGVRFRLPAGADADAEATYRDVAANHFEHLASSGAPGAAWFRYRANALRGPGSGEPAAGDDALELDRALEELGAAIEVPAAARRPGRDSELERTYGLFTGARAIAENLQLDRDLLVTGPGAATVDVDSLPGITVDEIDWAPLVDGKSPSIDPLATRIPADQHALLFPSFPALVTLVDEASRVGTPILRLLEDQAVDAATRSRYETQLGLELDAFARTFGPLVVRSVAVTGSDPYLRTGSDVAVLLECAEPEPLVAFL